MLERSTGMLETGLTKEGKQCTLQTWIGLSSDNMSSIRHNELDEKRNQN